MAEHKINAILVRTCSWKLFKKHLGQSIIDLWEYLQKVEDKYQVSSCGEGGEFETFVVDCPLYKKRIVIEESEVIVEKEYDFVGRLNFLKLRLEDKEN